MEGELSYIKGFNSGFKLKQFNPELYEKLKPSLSAENDFEKGVLEGAEEYEKSKMKSREDELENMRKPKSQDQDQEIQR